MLKAHDSPPFGVTTVMMAAAILKLRSLAPQSDGVLTLQTRTRARLVAGPVTVQLKAPSLAVEAAMTVHVAPAFRDSWRRTLPLTPVLVQSMRRRLLKVHPSPPFGTVRVSVARGRSRLCSAAAMSATPSR